MNHPAPGNLRIEPEALGPLSDRPLAETARSATPDDLFPGASAFLGARRQRARKMQWSSAAPLAEKLLRPDERLLHVVHAMEVPRLLHTMALGALTYTYHQVVLAVTDTRLVEIMLDVRGKVAGTRVRSFPWAGVRELKVGMGKLVLVPAEGRKLRWRVPARGDRKLLGMLIEKLKPRLLTERGSVAGTLPLWHCPQCGGVVEAEPSSCPSCSVVFRSKKMATLLSLAFPGAGLLYAGHPWLAASDFLGELFAYGIFLMLLLGGEPGTLAVAIGLGVFLFCATKLESVHVSRMLVARSKPETSSVRSGYGRFALAGALLSLACVAGAFPLASATRPIVDSDLAYAVEGGEWQVNRNKAEWQVFGDDETARSQWSHPAGLTITLFAYPQGALSSPLEFRNGLRAEYERRGTSLVADDEDVPLPYHGFRFVTHETDGSGNPISAINYFVLDDEHRDLHQALAVVVEEDAEAAEGMMRDFLTSSRFVEVDSASN